MIQKHKRVLLVFDKFKDTLSSAKVCEIVSSSLAGVEVRSVPISDGGDGFVDCMQHVLGGEKREVAVSDPLGREAKAQYLVDKGTAYVEVANSAGLQMLRVEERNPAFASSVVSCRRIEAWVGNGPGDKALCRQGGSAQGSHWLRGLGLRGWRVRSTGQRHEAVQGLLAVGRGALGPQALLDQRRGSAGGG